jgi:hypothetical protein
MSHKISNQVDGLQPWFLPSRTKYQSYKLKYSDSYMQKDESAYNLKLTFMPITERAGLMTVQIELHKTVNHIQRQLYIIFINIYKSHIYETYIVCTQNWLQSIPIC